MTASKLSRQRVQAPDGHGSGQVLIVFGLVAWGGQALSRSAPETVERLSLVERTENVEAFYRAGIRGEAFRDFFTP